MTGDYLGTWTPGGKDLGGPSQRLATLTVRNYDNMLFLRTKNSQPSLLGHRTQRKWGWGWGGRGGQVPENLVSCVQDRLLAEGRWEATWEFLAGRGRRDLLTVKMSGLHFDRYVKNGLRTMGDPNDN